VTNLSNPDDPRVIEALTRECDQCKQPVGAYCVNHIRPGTPLPGRLIHFGRLENAMEHAIEEEDQ
jgi:hypothetical protein